MTARAPRGAPQWLACARMKVLRPLVVALAAVGALSLLLFGVTVWGGFSARAKESAVERRVADWLRDLATPRSARDARSPVVGTPDVLARARRHFAIECAMCHGNDGRGSDLGGRFFPRAPDLRDTGDMTEGEIFDVIENGIRWTAMPSFADPSDPEEARSHWELVYFIRHLPDLMESEIEEMRGLNPRSPAEADGPAGEGHAEHSHGGAGEHAMHSHGGAELPAAKDRERRSQEAPRPTRRAPAGAASEAR